MFIADILIVAGMLTMACAGALAASEVLKLFQAAIQSLSSAASTLSRAPANRPRRPRPLRKSIDLPSGAAPAPAVNFDRARLFFVAGTGLVLSGLALRAALLVFAAFAPTGQTPGAGPDSGFSISPSVLIAAAFGLCLLLGSRTVRALFGDDWGFAAQVAGVVSCIIALCSLLNDLFGTPRAQPPDTKPVPEINVIGAVIPKTDRVEFSQLPSLPPFGPGDAAITPQLRDAICMLRQTAREVDSSAIVVVGRHDQTELTPAARRQFFSNSGLALRRAEVVQRALSEPGTCGAPPLLNVISVHSGPNYIGLRVPDANLTVDRQIEVFHLRRVP